MENFVSSCELLKCLLCHDAPCSKACPYKQDPAKVIKSLRFANYEGALKNLNDACKNCGAPCEKQCVLGSEIKIKKILSNCYSRKEQLNFDYKKLILKVIFVE